MIDLPFTHNRFDGLGPIQTELTLEEFTDAYIECALWSSSDDNG